jgi:hypothetical protein
MAWLALIAGNGLQSVVTALLGLSLTAADSLLLLALVAAACTLLGAVATRRNHSTVSFADTSAVRQLVWLNIWTAVSFVAFFLGVAAHSASVVFTLEASFAPLGVIAWTAFRVHRGGEQPLPGAAQWWAACMLATLGGLLVVVMAPSACGETIALLVAAMLGVIAGGAAGAVVIVSRDLSRSGISVGQVMARRFYATGAFALTALFTMIPCGMLAPPVLPLGLIGAAALASVVAPLFLLQYAIQRLAPVSVAAALAIMPTIAIAVELASGRVVNWIVALLVVLIVPANLALLMTRRQENLASPSLSVVRTQTAATAT